MITRTGLLNYIWFRYLLHLFTSSFGHLYFKINLFHTHVKQPFKLLVAIVTQLLDFRFKRTSTFIPVIKHLSQYSHITPEIDGLNWEEIYLSIIVPRWMGKNADFSLTRYYSLGFLVHSLQSTCLVRLTLGHKAIIVVE